MRAGDASTIHLDYSADAPNDAAEHAQLRECLSELRSALVARGDAERLPLIDNFERTSDRDGLVTGGAAWTAARDASIARNFTALRSIVGRQPKVIMWAASVHVARDARVSPLYAGIDNMGAAIARRFGTRAFVLAFGAVTGDYRSGGQVQHVPPVAPDSLEGRAGGAADTIYLDGPRLRALGIMEASFLTRGEPRRARWADLVDGAVIFRNERPPELATIPR